MARTSAENSCQSDIELIRIAILENPTTDEIVFLVVMNNHYLVIVSKKSLSYPGRLNYPES